MHISTGMINNNISSANGILQASRESEICETNWTKKYKRKLKTFGLEHVFRFINQNQIEY